LETYESSGWSNPFLLRSQWNMTNLKVCCATVVTIITLVCPYATGQANRSCGSVERLKNATRLVLVLYPELSNQEISLSLSEGGGTRNSPADVRSPLLVLDKPIWQPQRKGNVTRDDKDSDTFKVPGLSFPIFLEFNFIPPATKEDAVRKDFIPKLSCYPLQISNNTETEQRRQAEAEINGHPEWSDDQMLEAARRHGLRYGPEKKQAIVHLIPWQKLSTFYGPLRLKKAKFEIYGNTVKCEGCDFADLRWYVDADKAGSSRKLRIIMEPFDGKIVDLREYTETK
jgi:hypothetical protein